MRTIEYARGLLISFSILMLLSACSTSKFEGDKPDPKLTPESQDIQRRASIRLQLAIEYYQSGQNKLALEEIKQVTAITPDLAEAYALRGLILMDSNDIERAEENFLHSIKLDSTNSDFVQNYAWFLCQTNREKKAIPYFERVLADRFYATPVKAMINAAVCSLRLKDVSSAEKYFTQGFNLQPNNPSINVNLAKIAYDRGNFERAKFYIDRVLKEEIFAVDVLWLAIKIENKLNDQNAVNTLATQLRRRYPDSKEYALFQKGTFNE